MGQSDTVEQKGKNEGMRNRETMEKEQERARTQRGRGLPTVRGRGRWLDTAQTVQGVAGGNFCIGVESWETIDTHRGQSQTRENRSCHDREQGGLSGKVTAHVRSTRTVRMHLHR